jgi:hypothetical protein
MPALVMPKYHSDYGISLQTMMVMWNAKNHGGIVGAKNLRDIDEYFFEGLFSR